MDQASCGAMLKLLDLANPNHLTDITGAEFQLISLVTKRHDMAPTNSLSCSEC